MTWHGEGLEAPHRFYPRIVDDARHIECERTGAYGKGFATIFSLTWRRQTFRFTADGPYIRPEGGPRAWMDLQVFLPAVNNTHPRATNEPVVDIAIEALIVHGLYGEGLLRPDRTFWVLRDKRIYFLGEDGALQSRDATRDEQRAYTKQREIMLSHI